MSRGRDRTVWYTVWNAKTDEVLAFGDGPTCARTMGITHQAFLSIVSRVGNGQNKKYVILKEKIGEE